MWLYGCELRCTFESSSQCSIIPKIHRSTSSNIEHASTLAQLESWKSKSSMEATQVTFRQTLCASNKVGFQCWFAASTDWFTSSLARVCDQTKRMRKTILWPLNFFTESAIPKNCDEDEYCVTRIERSSITRQRATGTSATGNTLHCIAKPREQSFSRGNAAQTGMAGPPRNTADTRHESYADAHTQLQESLSLVFNTRGAPALRRRL